jgi:hypothetical protein
LHLIVFLTLIKVFVSGDYAALDNEYAGEDSE